MSITRAEQNKPLADRLRGALKSKYGYSTGLGTASALLLDISGSMNDWIGANRTKLSELRILAAEFTNVRRFLFSTTCREMNATEDIGDTEGGTNLANGFLYVKKNGIDHVVLITDGEPDSESMALTASAGLRIDCFYVGPDPAPAFLAELCKKTGGTYAKASMNSVRELSGAVRARLQLNAAKGIIQL